MRFAVKAWLDYRFDEPAEVLLLLEAARSSDQAVISENLAIGGEGRYVRRDDAATGERRVVFSASGHSQVRYEAEVEVTGREGDYRTQPRTAVRDMPPEVLPYLRQSRYCPSDRMEGFVHKQFGALQGGAKAGAIADWIAQNLEYRIGASTAATTALDTFLDGAGVCRDFTHLAITLLRAAEIPARAVSAYAWKLNPPDMHAVAEVYLGGRWWLMDSTCMAPVEGLVRVATGRDAADIAFMTVFGKAELLYQSFEVTALDQPPGN